MAATRKTKECVREADRWYSACVNFGKSVIAETNSDVAIVRTSFIVIHALMQTTSYTFIVPQGLCTDCKCWQALFLGQKFLDHIISLIVTESWLWC